MIIEQTDYECPTVPLTTLIFSWDWKLACSPEWHVFCSAHILTAVELGPPSNPSYKTDMQTITFSFYIWVFSQGHLVYFQGLEPRPSYRKIMVCVSLGRSFGFPPQAPPPWEQHCWRTGKGGFVCCCLCIQGLVCWATNHCTGQCMFYFPEPNPSHQWKWWHLSGLESSMAL